MVSLISMIWGILKPHEIIQVRRIPPVKGLRAHILALTISFMLVSINLLPGLSPWGLGISFWLLLWFGVTSYFSGIFFVLTLLVFLVSKLVSLAPMGAFAAALADSSSWYFLGYGTGAIFALLYNDLLFLYLNIFAKDRIKISFAYDPKRRLNIIKSPIETDEKAFKDLFADKPDLKKYRLYQYKLVTPPEQPYTIAFVANPKIRKQGEPEANEASYMDDPIIRNRDLFLRTVDRALFSLERDAAVGRPEIWSRIRIITIFNPDVLTQPNCGSRYGMIEEFQETVTSSSGEEIGHNLLDPMRQMESNFMTLLAESRAADDPEFALQDIDVIFGITASPTHDRSAAHYSDWIEHDDSNPLLNTPGRAGTPFTMDIDPDNNKDLDREGNPVVPPNTVYPALYAGPIVENPVDPAKNFRKMHDFYAIHPGRVALNALSARHKTYIHEFAHAMSSAFHGTICDEYVDFFVVGTPAAGETLQQYEHFFVNRIDRNLARMQSATPIPVPKLFTEYNGTRFSTDTNHPSAEEGWTGYFPARFSDTVPCTMDRGSGRHRFDELLGSFVYDRLMAKTVRAKTAKIKTAEQRAEEPQKRLAEAEDK